MRRQRDQHEHEHQTRSLLRRIGRVTRMVDPEAREAMRRRWSELPEHARTPEQVIGRAFIGCEGTHGVFPRCDFTCKPCYHSKDANHVRVDGAHTLDQIDRQMAHLRAVRGPHAHAQLIGGEVSLLDPDDHAAAIALMEGHGRVPMSFTHGDFDYDHLRRIVLGPDGRPRLRRISFAAHFDITMRGRRGAPRPHTERELDPYRRTFCEMFTRLRRELGVRSFLAHNMTVTPENLGQIAGTVASCLTTGFSMLSFQPAAYVGDDRRWEDDYRSFGPDEVWRQIEAGIGSRLSWRTVQYGDTRCNRIAVGFLAGKQWVALLDDEEPADAGVRDAYYRHFGGANLGATAPALFAVRLLRLTARHPGLLPLAAGWARRLVRRAGGAVALGRHVVRRRVRPMTIVMHNFIDAADVGPAWELLQRGETSTEPRIRAAQERLQACTYSMAHPETGRLVPACVQHSVLDPGENAALRRLLPIVEVR